MLHLFNPENDLALGLGCRHYTPPPRAAAIHDAGALLPVWWARDDDFILAPGASEADVAWLSDRFGLSPRVVAGLPPEAPSVTPVPWGWSLDARRQFAIAGVSEATLPSLAWLDEHRRLSHRATSIEILRHIGSPFPLPLCTADADAAVAMERTMPGCYVKSPWSGSGRGVFPAAALPAVALRSRIEGIIHRQGSVIVEPGLPGKLMDLAALFTVDGGRVSYRGLSIFRTEGPGTYAGNIVASQAYLREILSGVIAPDVYDRAVSLLTDALTDIVAPVYSGPLGIDMMVFTGPDGEPQLHPCIEMNLRLTMGFVALALHRRLSPSPSLLAWTGTETPGSRLILPEKHGFQLRLMDLSSSEFPHTLSDISKSQTQCHFFQTSISS